MNRSSAFSGLLLLLCACSDPDVAAQQLNQSEATAMNHSASVSATDAPPVANPANASHGNGRISMKADEKGDAGLLRPSFDACIAQSGGVTPEMQDCIAVEAEYQEGRLASAYEDLRPLLGAAEREALDSEQTAWISGRRETCTWGAAEEGQGQLLDAEGCALDMTARRAAELDARLQER